MNKAFIVVVVFHLSAFGVIAQDTQHSKQGEVQTFSGLELRHANPMYVIDAADRELRIPPATDTNHSFSLDLPEIKAQWIESITVIKGQDAINRYGTLGQYGVVVVDLKDRAFEEMPAHLAERFKLK